MRAAAPALHDELTGEPRYAAVVFVSAHWQARDGFAVTASARPRGSAAKGDPALAATIARLLGDAKIPCMLEKYAGIDDVVYGPLNVMFPQLADGTKDDIAVLALSINRSTDAVLHARAGRALATLTDGDRPVLFVGSGHTWHNFSFTHAATAARPAVRTAVQDFEAGLSALLVGHTGADASRNLEAWESVPHARYVHENGSGDHLMPLLVVAGASGASSRAKPIPFSACHGLESTDFVFVREEL